MSFNFGISAESAVRNAKRTLSPWNIHQVTFKGCEIKEFNGKKDPTARYKVLAINFENEDGYFTVTNFFPKEGDEVRRVYEGKNGGSMTLPSNFELLMAMVKQTAQILNPAGFEKMQAASSKFKNFDDVAKALIQITNPVIGTTTNIKLIGKNKDNKVVADIPRIVAINKDGESYICDNYIGSKLFFSDYEETQRNKFTSSTPTTMPEDPLKDLQNNSSQNKEDDFNLEDLL